MTDDAGEWKSASWKQEEDHSAKAAEAIALVSASTVPVLLRTTTKTLDAYLDDLLAVEKIARLGGDALSTQKLAVEVIRICRTLKNYDLMLSHLETLIKRRAQMKQVQSAMVVEASLALAEDGPNADPAMAPTRRVEILSKLEHVTSGKIHVELEHARFTVDLASIAARESRLKEASDMLYAIQVETITNMPRLEKLRIILTEIRLALDLGDDYRAQVMSRKINPRALAKTDTAPIKGEYFALMARYYERHDAPLHMAACWFEISETEPSQERKRVALGNAIVLATCAPHLTTKEATDLAECSAFTPHAFAGWDRKAWLKQLVAMDLASEELGVIHSIAKAFTSVELIRAAHAAAVAELCQSHPILAAGAKWQAALQSRLGEHDLLVVASHFSRIHLHRLATLVGLTPEQTEAFIMRMVTTKVMYAKMDRVDGTVLFQRKKNPVEVTQQWNAGVERIVGLVEKSCHLVAKERMIRAVASPIALSAGAQALLSGGSA